MKSCTTCKVEKPLTEFNKNCKTKDGRQTKCRVCRKAWGQAKRDLGCSIQFLKAWLQSQFKPGMTWDNHGSGHNGKGMQEWHIDHVIPMSSFNLQDRNELLKACHFTNLQPLWAQENLHKSNNLC